MGSESLLRSVDDRRGFMMKAGLGAAGAAVGMVGLTFPKAFADDDGSDRPEMDTTLDIFSGALTAEQLAVTFYFNGLSADPSVFMDVLSNDHIHYFQGAVSARSWAKRPRSRRGSTKCTGWGVD